MASVFAWEIQKVLTLIKGLIPFFLGIGPFLCLYQVKEGVCLI